MSDKLDANFAKKTLQDYEVISVLGSGAFGTCYKVLDKSTGELYAWKAIDYDELSSTKTELLISEINVLRQLHHPNIVQYYHHLNSQEAKSIFIIMEWCEGGDLAQLIAKASVEHKRFEESYIWRVLFQICKALQACHKKIKQGIAFHWDIKPANIFLDCDGNAKLGDFDLARVVQRSQHFADTYNMSPEILQGTQYNVKSDVWTLGCLIYEMCTLRPSFKGEKFKQLSLDLNNVEIGSISNVYSNELQEIIFFLLVVSCEKRPSVEMVARHPNVVRNIKPSHNSFTQLVVAEEEFYAELDHITQRTCLTYNTPSVMSSKDNSYRLSSDVFTPDLRKEIFYAANRQLYSRTLHSSNPEIYERVRQKFVGKPAEKYDSKTSPDTLTQNVFNDLLQQRLHAIRAHELLLQQKEESLRIIELQLNDKERRLQNLQCKLDKQQTTLESKIKIFKQSKCQKPEITVRPLPNTKRESLIRFQPTKQPQRVAHDDSYCSIEPHDAVSPTVAKLNPPTLPVAKAFSALRKVTFQSPKKFISYDIENIAPKAIDKSRNSMCSSDGSNSEAVNQRRKSILSIFGIRRSNKGFAANDHVQQASKPQDDHKVIVSRYGPENLTNIWTKEHKRAAFDLLAAMNATDGPKRHDPKSELSSRNRQSMRNLTNSSMRRDRLRRSLKELPVAI